MSTGKSLRESLYKQHTSFVYNLGSLFLLRSPTCVLTLFQNEHLTRAPHLPLNSYNYSTAAIALKIISFPSPAVQFSFTSVLPPNLFDNCWVNRLNPGGTLLIEWGSKFSFFQAYSTYQVARCYSCCQYLSWWWEDGGQMPVLGKG